MPKITRGGGASHAEDLVETVEAPQPVEPAQLPAADSAVDTSAAVEADERAAASDDTPASPDIEPTTEADPRPRARRRTVSTATVEGS